VQIDNRNFFPNILNDKKYKIGIEVGTYEGEFSKQILNNWDGILYSLDVWDKLSDEYVDSSNKSSVETIYKVIDNINGFEDRSVLIRTSSEYGSKMFPDEYFDFVYIDANHKYEYVKNDFDNSLKILNKFGIIILHDTDPMNKILLDEKYCNDAYKIVDYISKNKELNIITLPIQETGLSLVMRKKDRRINSFL